MIVKRASNARDHLLFIEPFDLIFKLANGAGARWRDALDFVKVASLKALGAPWIFSTATNLLASPFNCVIKENV